MDHRAFVQSMPAAQRLALTARRNGPGLWRLGLHLGVILALAALVAARVPGWPLLMLPLGVVLTFLFTPLHEVSHDTVFTARWLNRSVAVLCGFLILIPPRWFRYFHFAHHKHTHDPDRDPELANPKPTTWAGYVIYLSGLPLWRSLAGVFWRNARGTARDDYVPDRQRTAIRREAQIMLACYALLLAVSVAAGSALLLWVWIVPLVLGQPFLRAYLLAEHTLCPHVDDMFANTRTTFTTRAVRWLAWNMPYHAEHHAWPAVPFHQLPALHALTRRHLRQTAQGYSGFHATYRDGLR